MAKPRHVTGRAGADSRRYGVRMAAELIWRDERGQEIVRSGPLETGTRKIGIPLDAEHVDLMPGCTPKGEGSHYLVIELDRGYDFFVDGSLTASCGGSRIEIPFATRGSAEHAERGLRVSIREDVKVISGAVIADRGAIGRADAPR